MSGRGRASDPSRVLSCRLPHAADGQPAQGDDDLAGLLPVARYLPALGLVLTVAVPVEHRAAARSSATARISVVLCAPSSPVLVHRGIFAVLLS